MLFPHAVNPFLTHGIHFTTPTQVGKRLSMAANLKSLYPLFTHNWWRERTSAQLFPSMMRFLAKRAAECPSTGLVRKLHSGSLAQWMAGAQQLLPVDCIQRAVMREAKQDLIPKGCRFPIPWRPQCGSRSAKGYIFLKVNWDVTWHNPVCSNSAHWYGCQHGLQMTKEWISWATQGEGEDHRTIFYYEHRLLSWNVH